MASLIRAAQLTLDEINRVFGTISRRLLLSYGDPTLIVHDSYAARLGDLVVVKPGLGGASVELPGFRRADIGKSVTVVNASDSTRTITVSAAGGLVNGLKSVETAKEYSVRQAVAADFESQLWLLTAVSEGVGGVAGGGESPIWEWNGTDVTSQFDAPVCGSGLTGATASVVSDDGENWIQIEVARKSATGSYEWNKCAALPIISGSFGTANYRIECQHRIKTATSIAYASAGLAVRLNTGAGVSTPGTGTLLLHPPSSTSPGYRIADGQATLEVSLRSRDASVYPTTTAVDQIEHYELEIAGSGIVEANVSGQRQGIVTATAASTELQAALIAGCTQPTGTPTYVHQFRNVKVWAA